MILSYIDSHAPRDVENCEGSYMNQFNSHLRRSTDENYVLDELTVLGNSCPMSLA